MVILTTYGLLLSCCRPAFVMSPESSGIAPYLSRSEKSPWVKEERTACCTASTAASRVGRSAVGGTPIQRYIMTLTAGCLVNASQTSGSMMGAVGLVSGGAAVGEGVICWQVAPATARAVPFVECRIGSM